MWMYCKLPCKLSTKLLHSQFCYFCLIMTSFKNAWSYDVVPQYSHQNPNLNLVIDIRTYLNRYIFTFYSTRRHAKVEIRKLKKSRWQIRTLNKGLFLQPWVEGSQQVIIDVPEVLDVQLRGFPDTGVVLVVNFFLRQTWGNAKIKSRNSLYASFKNFSTITKHATSYVEKKTNTCERGERHNFMFVTLITQLP